MLSQQVDGIGIGNGTSWAWRSTRHFVGTVHVQEILANDRITFTTNTLYHLLFLHVSRGNGTLHRPMVVHLDQTFVLITEKQHWENRITNTKRQSDVCQLT